MSEKGEAASGLAAAVMCHGCGYDVHAQPAEGRCPECDTAVAESREMAKVPVRPAWGESDPRWRRRMILGVWLLAAMPVMDFLVLSGLAERMPVPVMFDYKGTVATLGDTLAVQAGVYPVVLFFAGVVLLFSRERGRRRLQTDFVRRWGVLLSYLVVFLWALGILFAPMLTAPGIASLLMSLPIRHRLWQERWFVEMSYYYLKYVPDPTYRLEVGSVIVSAGMMLLACVPMKQALESVSLRWQWFWRWWAWVLPGVLAGGAVLSGMMILPNVVRVLGDPSFYPRDDVAFASPTYFWPAGVAGVLLPVVGWSIPAGLAATQVVEVVKWLAVLAIALALSVAQAGAWWRKWRSRPPVRPKTPAGEAARN